MAEKSLMDGKKILLVDDEPDVLDTLEDLLSMCEVVKCTNYKAAKDYMENRDFDMAVLDIMGVEGYELLDIAVGRNITAVMLTAHAMSPANLVRSYKEGAAAYLPKEEMINIESVKEERYPETIEGTADEITDTIVHVLRKKAKVLEG